MSYFPRFSELPAELSRLVWLLALPGPRIVYVQRCLSRKGEEFEQWRLLDHETSRETVPTHFMSLSSSQQVVALRHACRESRSVAEEIYTLLLPASSTWFSFEADFLYLDFGRRLHDVIHYEPRDFTASVPEPFDDETTCDYWRPRFNEELAKKVKNLIISTQRQLHDRSFGDLVSELVTIFTGVQVLALADQLFNDCHEHIHNKDLVWLKGQVGDEVSSSSRLEIDIHDSEDWCESEIEKENRQSLDRLQFWTGFHYYFYDNEVNDFLREWKRATATEMPTVFRTTIVNTTAKDRLLAICRSDYNFLALAGFDWKFVTGEHEYSGPLNLFQQLGYLELLLDTKYVGCICTSEHGRDFEYYTPFLLYRIDMLVLEIMRLQEPTDTTLEQ